MTMQWSLALWIEVVCSSNHKTVGENSLNSLSQGAFLKNQNIVKYAVNFISVQRVGGDMEAFWNSMVFNCHKLPAPYNAFISQAKRFPLRFTHFKTKVSKMLEAFLFHFYCCRSYFECHSFNTIMHSVWKWRQKCCFKLYTTTADVLHNLFTLRKLRCESELL